MSAAKKTPRVGSAKPGPDTRALLAPAVTKAAEVLRDPEVRAQILEHGRAFAETAQSWRNDRRARPRSDDRVGIGARASDSIGRRFGQRRLEQRVENLRTAIVSLTEGRSGLAGRLTPVARAIEDVATTLTVAAALPAVKRKRAHLKIDSVLDDLETGLFDTALNDRGLTEGG